MRFKQKYAITSVVFLWSESCSCVAFLYEIYTELTCSDLIQKTCKRSFIWQLEILLFWQSWSGLFGLNCPYQARSDHSFICGSTQPLKQMRNTSHVALQPVIVSIKRRVLLFFSVTHNLKQPFSDHFQPLCNHVTLSEMSVLQQRTLTISAREKMIKHSIKPISNCMYEQLLYTLQVQLKTL